MTKVKINGGRENKKNPRKEVRKGAGGAVSRADWCWQRSLLQSYNSSHQHSCSGRHWTFRVSLCVFCSLYCCSCQIPEDQHTTTKNENWIRAVARATHRAEGNNVRAGQEEQ